MIPANRDPYFAEIARLRAQNEELLETVRQLEEALAPNLLFPDAWRLTGTEQKMLSALYAARSGAYRTKEQLHLAISGVETETEIKIVDVYICKLRNKLPVGAIETLHGRGYCLTPAGRRLIAAAIGHAEEPRPALALVRQIDPAPAESELHALSVGELVSVSGELLSMAKRLESSPGTAHRLLDLVGELLAAARCNAAPGTSSHAIAAE